MVTGRQTIFQAFQRWMDDHRERRRRVRTRRMLAALPLSMQQDIGWDPERPR
ncbi:hypothetical protein [Nitratireductor sp. ZSWI3]|uniref:hypothetical protein n=1 Tax=Nitratireductor sp. ZSWI3 TaxID=2966359 RepID=UPI00215001E7|nr:hypothetical protein [Nitratireductor sp. ZSWI3]MCR4268749.1 hypothetical protein [Nitratireductor sp. ZSWI3]